MDSSWVSLLLSALVVATCAQKTVVREVQGAENSQLLAHRSVDLLSPAESGALELLFESVEEHGGTTRAASGEAEHVVVPKIEADKVEKKNRELVKDFDKLASTPPDELKKKHQSKPKHASKGYDPDLDIDVPRKDDRLDQPFGGQMGDGTPPPRPVTDDVGLDSRLRAKVPSDMDDGPVGLTGTPKPQKPEPESSSAPEVSPEKEKEWKARNPSVLAKEALSKVDKGNNAILEALSGRKTVSQPLPKVSAPQIPESQLLANVNSSAEAEAQKQRAPGGHVDHRGRPIEGDEGPPSANPSGVRKPSADGGLNGDGAPRAPPPVRLVSPESNRELGVAEPEPESQEQGGNRRHLRRQLKIRKPNDDETPYYDIRMKGGPVGAPMESGSSGPQSRYSDVRKVASETIERRNEAFLKLFPWLATDAKDKDKERASSGASGGPPSTSSVPHQSGLTQEVSEPQAPNRPPTGLGGNVKMGDLEAQEPLPQARTSNPALDSSMREKIVDPLDAPVGLKEQPLVQHTKGKDDSDKEPTPSREKVQADRIKAKQETHLIGHAVKTSGDQGNFDILKALSGPMAGPKPLPAVTPTPVPRPMTIREQASLPDVDINQRVDHNLNPVPMSAADNGASATDGQNGAATHGNGGYAGDQANRGGSEGVGLPAPYPGLSPPTPQIPTSRETASARARVGRGEAVIRR